MRSDSPQLTARLGLLALCCLFAAAALAGCTTTQETAATKQAESKRFLQERERRRDRNKHAEGTKSSDVDGKSAHRQEGNDQ